MSTIRLALFGSPVAHSPSPGVHDAFGAQFGLDVDYRLIEATEEAFDAQLADFREGGGIGCNVTLPLKHQACRMADNRTPRADLAMAANTLWWDPDGHCLADNTDGAGLVRDLEHNLGIEIAGRKVLLLGAGGAAAGVLGALLERKPAQLVIVNRTIERARILASRHGHLAEVSCASLDDFGRCGPVDLFIDATSMGHSGQHLNVPGALLESDAVVYSLNYGDAAKGMCALAETAGAPFHDGLGMLVEQAALSFEIWTGHAPDTGPVLTALRKISV